MFLFSAILLLTSTLVYAQTNLPPLPDGTQWSAGTSITIDAPIDAVWDVLLDWEKYAEWNPFVRGQTLANEFFIPASVEDRTLDALKAAGSSLEGQRLILTVQIPPLPLPVDENTPSNLLHSQISFENITAMQPTQHRMAWRQMMFPDVILSAERWSALSRTGFLGLETLYESREGYGGALAGTLQALYGVGLQEAFDAQGVALKSRVEGS
ncbi:hypothetical protein QCA50_019767 [Cerrena zonata]|uniref:SRPBCC domain-containing protein n=1 Tax=Cerrena zonata TaxID=2478898 RepID=A0AAW0FIT6_9APHY